MEFEQFKRKMQSDKEILERKEVRIDDLIYHKFLKEMIEALREKKYSNFTSNDYVESLHILQLRFGSFLDELENFDNEGNKDADDVEQRIGGALIDMLDILEELKSLPEDPDNERFDQLLIAFRECHQEILNVNKEMEDLARKEKLDII